MRFSVKTTALHTVSSSVSVPKSGSTGRVFLSGVAVLTLSTILVKVIGLLYKIPMLHFLGSEGMGYFNAAYEWYATLCVITTSGLPLALSMMIASARANECEATVRRLERLSLRIFTILGFFGTVFLLFGSGMLARLIGSFETRFALAAVAPTVFFSCLSGAYRGYFQGNQDMVPTAVSQVIEAMGKLLLGLIFAFFAVRQGLDAPHIAARAMLGLSIGVALSTLYLWAHRRTYEKHSDGSLSSEREALLGKLLKIAIPITLSSSVMSLTRLFDMTMILRRLQDIGYDSAQSNALYGAYTTMVVPMFALIPSLITSVALALVPTLSAAIQSGDEQTQRVIVNNALRMTALLSLPASFAVAIYSQTILSLLFRGEHEAIAVAAPLLSLLSLSIFFSGVITTTNAILQAYGLVNLPILSMLIGSVVKLFTAYLLIGQPKIHIYGAPISTLLCDALIVGINLVLIVKRTKILPSISVLFLRPLFCSVIAVGIPGMIFAFLTRAAYPSIPLFLAAVPITVLFYGLLCLRSGMIGEQELVLLPSGLREKVTHLFHISSKETASERMP